MRGAVRICGASMMLASCVTSAVAGGYVKSEDAQCGALRGALLPLEQSVGRDVAERADGVDATAFRAYVDHRFDFTRLRGSHDIGFVFFSGRARYRQDGRLTVERVPGALVSDAFFDEREWRFLGRLSDIDKDGTLQMDPLVSAVSAALAFMAAGPAMDAAYRDASGRTPIPWPVVRGTVGFRYWYSCQGCVPGASGIAGGQDLASARFAQRNGDTFVITNAPRVVVAELGATGRAVRYFRCGRPVA